MINAPQAYVLVRVARRRLACDRFDLEAAPPGDSDAVCDNLAVKLSCVWQALGKSRRVLCLKEKLP